MTWIRVLNDTKKSLLVRLPPTGIRVEPQRMVAVYVDGEELFFKIWDGNIILIASADELAKEKNKE